MRETDLGLQRIQQAVALQASDKSGDEAGCSNIKLKNNRRKRIENMFETLLKDPI
jgi:hypothetical protein